MDRRQFIGAAAATVGVGGAVHAQGAAPDLRGYQTVFEDNFDTFESFDAIANPMGHWATPGRRALDGSMRSKVLRRPLTLAEIDADPILQVQHRCPESCGDYSMFTDASMGPEFDPFAAQPGRLAMRGREIPVRLRPRAAGRRYMSSRIWLTQGGLPRSFVYGFFEARIYLDMANSSYAAWWLMSADGWSGEIDIMEYLGHWPLKGDMYHTSAHLGPLSFGKQTPAKIMRTWRRFGVLWTEDVLEFYLDRALVRRIPNPGIHEPLYPTLNLSIASKWAMQPFRGGGGLPNPADLPMSMMVDRVLIQQKV